MFPLISANERCNPVMQMAWAGMIIAVPAVLFPLDLPDDGDLGLGIWDALPYGSPPILQPRDAYCRSRQSRSSILQLPWDVQRLIFDKDQLY